MNKHKLPILALSVVLFATACKKTDLLPASSNTTATTTATTTTTPAAADWKSVGSWQTNAQEKSTVYSSKIQDSTITADVVSKGLVLAYTKIGSGINAMPFTQKDGSNTYFWLYQVTPGAIQ